MPTDTATLGHQFSITATRHVAIPKARSSFNAFDEHGLVLGLPRLQGEKNSAYKRRLHTVMVDRANSSYRGLVNGITRELGLALFEPLVINPKKSPITDKFYAKDPYIKFDGTWLYLYSDYENKVLDYQIDRYEPGGNYEHLTRLVNFINNTTFWEASLTDAQYAYTRSMTIINQSNRLEAIEPVQASSKFQLENEFIVPGTVRFSDLDTFRVEKSFESQVTSFGDYYINYRRGLITIFSPPSPGVSIEYKYTDYSFQPKASPVILHDINDDNFKVKMFEQVTLNDGTSAHGVPTELGVDIINELLTVTPMYWGI